MKKKIKKFGVQNFAFVKSNLDRKGTLIKWPFPRKNKKIEKGQEFILLKKHHNFLQ